MNRWLEQNLTESRIVQPLLKLLELEGVESSRVVYDVVTDLA